MWILETVDVVLRGWLDNGGIQPRESEGLLGILFAPLLHGGFDHLLSNTIPLLVLGHARGDQRPGRVLEGDGRRGRCSAGSARGSSPRPNTVTIGASGLVFGYLGYLLVAGIRTRHWRDLLIGVAVLVVYGTLLLGALPWAVASNVSWQAHLTGAIAGGLAAWWFAPRRGSAAA